MKIGEDFLGLKSEQNFSARQARSASGPSSYYETVLLRNFRSVSYRTAASVALLSLDDFGHSYVTAEQTLISVLPDGAGNRPCGSFWPLRAAKISPGWKPPKHEVVALFGLF